MSGRAEQLHKLVASICDERISALEDERDWRAPDEYTDMVAHYEAAVKQATSIVKGETIPSYVQCERCGSTNVQIVMWYMPNIDETQDDYGSWQESDTKYCNDCDSHEYLRISEEPISDWCADCGKKVPAEEKAKDDEILESWDNGYCVACWKKHQT